ncbi:ATP-dependent RNA helicase ddx54 [Halocaridina rubra]|uniref:RNA helicase n=1 Tax=Halocaridina rubra TaxID=373956 RepID=A0AAN8WV56_HALRR
MAENLEGWGAPDGIALQEEEEDIRKLRIKQNKKGGKKAGAFQLMGLSKPVFKGIMKKGYKVPTPIQRKTLPVVLSGKDCVAMARTGSGKTACFLIPMFEKLQEHSAKTGARALILSPTRELALQTLKFTKELGCFMNLRAAVILGGDSMDGQFYAIHENPDILIATPGRLAHLIVEMSLKLNNVKYVVFDEADRLFEMGFAEQMNSIMKCIPEERQTLLFSATLPKMLVNFARAGLNDPVLVRLDVEQKLPENLKITFFKVKSEDKLALLLHILQQIIGKKEQTVIFAATKHHVEYIQMALELAKIPSTYCYSSLHSAARKINVAKFQTKKVRCLIVTDVAARGIDIPLLDNVINFHFPEKSKLFVHRVGRVARAGRSGTAYSFIAPDEAPYFMDLHMFLSRNVKFAPHPPDQNKRVDWDGVYGSVPQSVIDTESEQIMNMHNQSSELAALKKSMDGAYKQYDKSRPAPSRESVKRIKEDERLVTVGYHPLLIQDNIDLENKRLAMLEHLRNLQPRVTVFEMVKNRHDRQSVVFNNMQEKREYDGNRIDAFYKDLEQRRTARLEKEMKAQQALDKVQKLEQSTEDDIKNVFVTIVTDKKKTSTTRNEEKKEVSSKEEAVISHSIENNMKRKNTPDGDINLIKRKKKKKKFSKVNEKPKIEDYKEKEFYIPYAHKGSLSEDGYALQSNFRKDTDEAAMDLIHDDDANQRRNKALHKWNRHSKKFVSTQSNTRKIKTESGVWITASYKTGRYEKWLARGKKKEDADSGHESGDEAPVHSNKKKKKGGIKTVNIKAHATVHPLFNKLKGFKHHKRPPKRELRTEQEIVKETARKEAARLTNKEGRAKNKLKKKAMARHLRKQRRS